MFGRKQILFIVVLILFVSCGKPKEKHLIGVWHMDLHTTESGDGSVYIRDYDIESGLLEKTNSSGDVTESIESIDIEFKDDGICEQHYYVDTSLDGFVTGTWELKEDSLVINVADDGNLDKPEHFERNVFELIKLSSKKLILKEDFSSSFETFELKAE